MRRPHRGTRQITGLVLCYFLRVTGDGCSTLAQLMTKDVQTQRLRGTLRRAASFVITRRTRRPWARVCAQPQLHRPASAGCTAMVRRASRPPCNAGLTRLRKTCACLISAALMRGLTVWLIWRLASGEFTSMEVNRAGSQAIEAWDSDIGVRPGVSNDFC